MIFDVKKVKRIILITTIFIFFFTIDSYPARLKDIVEVEGVRENQLVGYGLVMGLNGTGDGDDVEFTVQSLTSFLKKSGINIDPNLIKYKNVAAVMVTAKLPPFARPGTKVDVLVSSIGDATSLQGGTLLQAPLKGADGKVYAVAQGPISIGGFNFGAGGNTVQKNHPTVGVIVNGAIVERNVPVDFQNKKEINFSLRFADFTTANQIVEKINKLVGANCAFASDASTIKVSIPGAGNKDPVSFLAQIEGIDITPDTTAKIVFDERTGTVIMGENVRISTVAIAHGNLSIQISKLNDVSQPQPFSKTGQTKEISQTEVSVEEEKSNIAILDKGVSIGEIVKALNALGVTPRDLIAIFQTMKSAGALQAELVIY